MEKNELFDEFNDRCDGIVPILNDYFSKLPSEKEEALAATVYLTGTYLFLLGYIENLTPANHHSTAFIEATAFADNTDDYSSLEILADRLRFDLKNRNLDLPPHQGNVVRNLIAWAKMRIHDMFDLKGVGDNQVFDTMVDELDVDWKSFTEFVAHNAEVSQELGKRSNPLLHAFENDESVDLITEVMAQASCILSAANTYLATFYEDDKRLFSWLLIASENFYESISVTQKDPNA